jgi:hypothetical protein
MPTDRLDQKHGHFWAKWQIGRTKSLVALKRRRFTYRVLNTPVPSPPRSQAAHHRDTHANSGRTAAWFSSAAPEVCGVISTRGSRHSA